MKIDNFASNIMSFYQKENIFKENMILKGKVLDLMDGRILVEFKEQGIIQALLETPLDIQVGEEIPFLVKSVDNTLVQLKAMTLEGESIAYDSLENDFAYKLLKGFNLRVTKDTIVLIKHLMNYNVSLTEENINNSIMILDKLLSLNTISDNEKVISIDKTDFNMTNVLDDENFEIKNTDIKYLLITDKAEYQNLQDLSDFLDNFMETKITLENQGDFMKTISFLIKNNMKPTLNNIWKLIELKEDPLEFIKEIKDLYETVSKNQNPDKILSEQEIQKPLFEIFSLNKEKIINQIKEQIKDIYQESHSSQREKIVNINDKILFLEELNKDMSHLFFPIHFKDNEMEGILTFIKEKRKKDSNYNKIFIFLKIPTENLGTVKMNCQLVGHSLYVKLNIKEEDFELFKSTKKLLIEKISLIGYSLKKIEFVTNQDFEIVDLLNSDKSKTYGLDIRV